MTIQKQIIVVALAAVMAPFVNATDPFKDAEIGDLPQEIRHDIYRYVLENIEVDTILEGPRRVQTMRLDDDHILTVHVLYDSILSEPGRGGISVICSYRKMVREKCSHQLVVTPPPKYIDPPLPEFQRSPINDSGI